MERHAGEGNRERKEIYTPGDCEAVDPDGTLAGKVVVLRADACPRNGGHQLAFCVGGDGAGPGQKGRHVILVDLRDGERARHDRADIIGLLKPGLLPDRERLQLSQIRPVGAAPQEGREPLYSGYCFLEDGRYAAGVWLYSEKEAARYVETQKPYQHRIMVCDRDDFCVLEVKEAKLVYPGGEPPRQMGEGPCPDGPGLT